MPEHRWPDDFAALRRGEGCPMCGGGADETPHGLRVFEGAWGDGYIGRYPVRPGYTYVIWKGRHVAEPWELSPEEAPGSGRTSAAWRGQWRSSTGWRR